MSSRTPACPGPSRHSPLRCISHPLGLTKVQPRPKVQGSPTLAHTMTSIRVIADHSSKPVFSTISPSWFRGRSTKGCAVLLTAQRRPKAPIRDAREKTLRTPANVEYSSFFLSFPCGLFGTTRGSIQTFHGAYAYHLTLPSWSPVATFSQDSGGLRVCRSLGIRTLHHWTRFEGYV